MLGNIISAGANLLGGVLGSKEKDKDRALQKDFAQQGIRWKVEDAKAAGVHPLYALGANTVSYSPVAGSSDLSSGLAAAGQDVGRAVNATQTQGERVSGVVQSLQIKRMELENQLLASQIARVNQAGSVPPMPTPGDRYLIEGQPNSPLVQTSPMGRQTSAPEAPHQEPAAVADIGFSRTPGGWAPVYSKDVKDRLEEDFIGSLAWSVRNRLLPALSSTNYDPPAGVELAPGEQWVYDPIRQEYRAVRRRGKYGFDKYYR